MTKEAAFAALYAQHYAQVRALCRHLLGTAERADDAAQEGFVRAFGSIGRFDPSRSFVAWLRAIVVNAAGYRAGEIMALVGQHLPAGRLRSQGFARCRP